MPDWLMALPVTLRWVLLIGGGLLGVVLLVIGGVALFLKFINWASSKMDFTILEDCLNVLKETDNSVHYYYVSLKDKIRLGWPKDTGILWVMRSGVYLLTAAESSERKDATSQFFLYHYPPSLDKSQIRQAEFANPKELTKLFTDDLPQVMTPQQIRLFEQDLEEKTS